MTQRETMQLLVNPYAPYMPEVRPGDSIKLHVNDGVISGKVWVRVLLRVVGSPLLLGRLEQFTVLNIPNRYIFFFEPKHIHYVMGQNERWG